MDKDLMRVSRRGQTLLLAVLSPTFPNLAGVVCHRRHCLPDDANVQKKVPKNQLSTSHRVATFDTWIRLDDWSAQFLVDGGHVRREIKVSNEWICCSGYGGQLIIMVD